MKVVDAIVGNRGSSAVLVLVSFFVLWQLAVVIFNPPAFIIPSPWVIVKEIAAEPGWTWAMRCTRWRPACSASRWRY